jgi:hypothetical protein
MLHIIQVDMTMFLGLLGLLGNLCRTPSAIDTGNGDHPEPIMARGGVQWQ